MPEFVEYCWVFNSILVRRAFGGTWWFLANLFAGKGNRVIGQTVFADDLVDQPDGMRFCGRNRVADHDHRQGGFRANDARQALGAGGAGDQAQFHFRQTDFGRRNRDPVMTGQGDLAAATESRTVDRRDHRLAAGLQLVQRLAQIGPLHRLAKFGNISTGKKCPSVAADDHRLDLVVRQGCFDPVDQPLANGGAQRIDWWIVCDDDQDILLLFSGNDGHFSLLRNSFQLKNRCDAACQSRD